MAKETYEGIREHRYRKAVRVSDSSFLYGKAQFLRLTKHSLGSRLGRPFRRQIAEGHPHPSLAEHRKSELFLPLVTS